ncbi:TetR/AcrR family transcriptional regulator [Alkaliphilus serpentinus]|uniref:TetR/AcrR family transcriptional regulator n=1 Tax=Alkaliphilus serpentinus TaxID=1482731 RepID=A0A833HMY7_9FIRM|nr:TetR/AcrR family transcriptional regulator [Alkaliphilus serpentinus]KAB3527268.1 TetR/AcrR family transcriptional regulator [Alkaliphilus serpentinus]
MKELEAREKIIATTTELIRLHGDVSKVTVRDIALKSGVGVGLINYHFTTKENLINQCVQRIISGVIDGFEESYSNLKLSPKEKLKLLFKTTADFVVKNSSISRISMLYDLSSGSVGDNTDQAGRAYLKLIKEIYGDKKTEREFFIIMHTLTSAIQVAFLRNTILKETGEFDFYHEEERNAFIDSVVDSIL